MKVAPEFSRPVPLARIGTDLFRQEIAATELERAALARRFDLVALDRLQAVVELVRQGERLVLLHAQFEAAFVQSCTVTLDPVESAVCQEFSLLYGPLADEEEAAALVSDEVAFEPIPGDTIDIGEAVAQEFSLALPPFPRSPDAVIEIDAPAPDDAGPFAGLAQIVARRRDEA